MTSLPVLNKRSFQPHPATLLEGTFTAQGQRRYCTYPFRQLNLASDYIKPCTWLRQIPGLSVLRLADHDGDLRNAWQSRPFNAVRRSIAMGDYLYCNLESCPEYKGEQRYFCTLEELRQHHFGIADYVTGATKVQTGNPELINIAYDTSCNLACPHCNRKKLPKLGRAEMLAISQSLYQLSDDVRYVFLAGMGDPFGSPHYYDWLCNVDVSRFANLKAIAVNTNGLCWNAQSWLTIPAATRARIKTAVISIDGASRETYEANRYPGRWDQLLDRLRFIASLRRSGEIRQLRAYFVYQANNYLQLPAMVRLCNEHAFDAVFFARIANWQNGDTSAHEMLDVANPRHVAHTQFLSIAERASAMSNERLQITIMR